ncbi:GntR family transcriptional regulator [Paracoccus aminophilus]|uniref:Transcriptional regulator, GntR family n=1 Tax=Paracoccus aminophilus JCM 7686 TaxID=1367847 RepID=S5YAY4_PARAH|nr:GntR family transcriptional regulator [Paracoccus aminophilus]AGT08563.1 transcriptional regulator, GntR family [Paracoccus aminophilus JCM 7686]
MTTQWRGLYDELAAAIQNGTLKPGQRLPTEHEQSASRAISRNTVRRAYLALSQAGLIRIVNGRGSYVMQTGLTYEIDSDSRFREVLERQGVASSIQTLSTGLGRAEPNEAEALSIKPGAAVLRQTMLILGEGTPFILTTRVFPADLALDLEERLLRLGSFTALLRDLGLGPLHRVSTTVGARMPEPKEARLLCCPLNAPVLDVVALGRLESGRPVEWQHALMNSRLIKLSFLSP